MSAIARYGAVRDSYDHRDYVQEYHGNKIPSHRHTEVDLREYVDQVYSQGSLNSCTANAVCAAYQLDLKKQAEADSDYTDFDPSRLFLYYNTRARKNQAKKNAGASLRDTIKALNTCGVCEESDWPYDTNKFRKKPTHQCYSDAEGNDLRHYKRLNHTDIHQLRACLKEKNPFVFGFEVYRSFHEAEEDGEMPMPTDRELRRDPLGEHAVVAVGYDDEEQQVTVLNSWGEDWGDEGYFYMPYDFITDSDFCFDFWKISFANEA